MNIDAYIKKYRNKFISLIQKGNRQCQEFAMLFSEGKEPIIIDGESDSVALPDNITNEQPTIIFHNHTNPTCEEKHPEGTVENALYDFHKRVATQNFSLTDTITLLNIETIQGLLGYEWGGHYYVAYIPRGKLLIKEGVIKHDNKLIGMGFLNGNLTQIKDASRDFYNEVNSITVRVKL